MEQGDWDYELVEDDFKGYVTREEFIDYFVGLGFDGVAMASESDSFTHTHTHRSLQLHRQASASFSA